MVLVLTHGHFDDGGGFVDRLGLWHLASRTTSSDGGCVDCIFSLHRAFLHPIGFDEPNCVPYPKGGSWNEKNF